MPRIVVGATAKMPRSSKRACTWARPLPEQRVRIEEGHLADVVGDRVVHAAHQLPAADVELLAALADLQRVEVERGAVAAAGGVVPQPERELGRGPCAQQQVTAACGRASRRSRRARACVGSANGCEVRERRCRGRSRPARPRDPARGGTADSRGRRRRRRSAPRGRAAGDRSGAGPLTGRSERLRRDADCQRGGVEVRAGDAVHLAHLVPEGRRVWFCCGCGDELEVSVAAGADGPRSTSGKVPIVVARRGPEADGEIVVLVELGGEHDPEARVVQVVVGALDQQLPAHRAELLRAVRRAGRGGDAAQVRD